MSLSPGAVTGRSRQQVELVTAFLREEAVAEAQPKNYPEEGFPLGGSAEK